MQGVKGTHSPGQHGTFVNRRPRVVKAGGIVQFAGERFQDDKLLDHVDKEVLVDEMPTTHDPYDYVGVYVCTRIQYYGGPLYRTAGKWLADAKRVGT